MKKSGKRLISLLLALMLTLTLTIQAFAEEPQGTQNVEDTESEVPESGKDTEEVDSLEGNTANDLDTDTNLTGDKPTDPVQVPEDEDAEKAQPSVVYSTHVQTYGWMDEVKDGEPSGTWGKSKRIEAISIRMEGDMDLQVQGKAFVQDSGWTGYIGEGSTIGTEGQSKAMYGLVLRLTGADAGNYDIWYRMHIQTYGWLDWAKTGERAGSTLERRIEALEVVVLPKSESPDSLGESEYPAYLTAVENDTEGVHIQYQAHVQTYGWQSPVSDGAVAGTSGQSKRIEAIKAYITGIDNEDLSLIAAAHVQGIGWIDGIKEGELIGTAGQSKRVEGFKFSLTGNRADEFSIYYRTHVQHLGWLNWASNGEISGTTGLSLRVEAVQILILPKDQEAPSTEDGLPYSSYSSDDCSVKYSAYHDDSWNDVVSGPETVGNTDSATIIRGLEAYLYGTIPGGVTYSALISNDGWSDWISDGTPNMNGEEQLEALRIKLTGTAKNLYNIYYRVYTDEFGWLGWAVNGQNAGTRQFGYPIRAFQIQILPKNGSKGTLPTGGAYKEKNYYYLMSEFTTTSTNTANGTYNMTKALAQFNGKTIQPGQTLSFNATTGYCGAANGYLLAGVVGGLGYGGGICQASTTLYGAYLRAGLTVIERRNHSVRSTYVPAGLDAMIDYGSSDLKIRNDHPFPVKIVTWTENKVLHCQIWGNPPSWYDKVVIKSWMTSSTTAQASRTYYLNGKVVKTEALPSSRYRK